MIFNTRFFAGAWNCNDGRYRSSNHRSDSADGKTESGNLGLIPEPLAQEVIEQGIVIQVPLLEEPPVREI